MKLTTIIVAAVAVTGCSKKEDSKSKPVTCEVAGQMVAKRLGEFADGKVAGERRVKLDKDMAAAITARCVEDKWDEVPLGCLGAVHSIPEGKLKPENYRGAVDTCTKAIGDEKWKKMEDAIGVVVRSLKQ
jgi:hypothetical protein